MKEEDDEGEEAKEVWLVGKCLIACSKTFLILLKYEKTSLIQEVYSLFNHVGLYLSSSRMMCSGS